MRMPGSGARATRRPWRCPRTRRSRGRAAHAPWRTSPVSDTHASAVPDDAPHRRVAAASRPRGRACRQQTLPRPCARVQRTGTAAVPPPATIAENRGVDRTNGPDPVQLVGDREGRDALRRGRVGGRTDREQRRTFVPANAAPSSAAHRGSSLNEASAPCSAKRPPPASTNASSAARSCPLLPRLCDERTRPRLRGGQASSRRNARVEAWNSARTAAAPRTAAANASRAAGEGWTGPEETTRIGRPPMRGIISSRRRAEAVRPRRCGLCSAPTAGIPAAHSPAPARPPPALTVRRRTVR